MYAMHRQICGFSVCNGGDLGGLLFTVSDRSGFTRLLHIQNMVSMGRFDSEADDHMLLEHLSNRPAERSDRYRNGQQTYVGRRLLPKQFGNELWLDVLLEDELSRSYYSRL